jgi:hypothetical protein
MADPPITPLTVDESVALEGGTASPEVATRALAIRHAAYRAASTPTPTTDRGAARAQLDALGNDPTWRAAFFAGNAAARQQFSELTARAAASDETAAVLAGDVPSDTIEITGSAVGGRITSRAMAVEVAALRESGLNDSTIAQIINGTPASPAEVEMAKRFKEMRLSDKEWVSRFLKGEWAEKREMHLISAILAGAPA